MREGSERCGGEWEEGWVVGGLQWWWRECREVGRTKGGRKGGSGRGWGDVRVV